MLIRTSVIVFSIHLLAASLAAQSVSATVVSGPNSLHVEEIHTDVFATAGVGEIVVDAPVGSFVYLMVDAYLMEPLREGAGPPPPGSLREIWEQNAFLHKSPTSEFAVEYPNEPYSGLPDLQVPLAAFHLLHLVAAVPDEFLARGVLQPMMGDTSLPVASQPASITQNWTLDPHWWQQTTPSLAELWDSLAFKEDGSALSESNLELDFEGLWQAGLEFKGQSAAKNFLASSDYETVLNAGLTMTVQVYAVHNPLAPIDIFVGPVDNPQLRLIGAGTSSLETLVSQPITIFVSAPIPGTTPPRLDTVGPFALPMGRRLHLKTGFLPAGGVSIFEITDSATGAMYLRPVLYESPGTSSFSMPPGVGVGSVLHITGLDNSQAPLNLAPSLDVEVTIVGR